MRRNGSGSTRRFQKHDIVLIVFFLIIAIVGLLWLNIRREGGHTVRVTVDGTVMGDYPLNRDNTISIKGVGGENTLVIENGQADMTEADCPDKVCVDHAPISDVGESIICLPHKVVVEIISVEGGTENQNFDVITH